MRLDALCLPLASDFQGWEYMRVASRLLRLMPPRVLVCDPSSITFSGDGIPNFTSQSTKSALESASQTLLVQRTPVVLPTETVYGLGAPALIPSAVSLIFSTKGRPADNPLIVHVSSITMLHSILTPGYTWPKTYELLIKAFWPGPLTLLFPSNPDVIPPIVTAGQPLVAVRMPSHPVARALIAVSNAPLAAPSANSSGKPSPTKVEHVLRDTVGNKVDVILDGGPCHVGVESTVIDGLHPDGKLRILRPGGITVEDIEHVVGKDSVMVHRRDYEDKQQEVAPTTPGMKYRHYSPSVPVVLLLQSPPPPDVTQQSLHTVLQSAIEALPPSPSSRNEPSRRSSIKIGLLAPPDSTLTPLLTSPSAKRGMPPIVWHMYPLGAQADPKTSARRLFDGLLSLEAQGVELIIMEGIDESREGMAVMNRAKKAAGDGIRWVKKEI